MIRLSQVTWASTEINPAQFNLFVAGDQKPINIHLVNGQQVTTLPPTTTTESENVEGITSWYDSDNGV